MKMLRAWADLAFLFFALQWAIVAYSQATPTNSAPPVATSAITNCQDTVPGTNVSVCFFTTAGAPVCARGCLQQVALMTPCATTDLKCLCAHSTDLQTGVLPCLQGNCTLNDITATVNYYYGICNDNHLPLQGAAASTGSSLAPTSTPLAAASTSQTPTAGLSQTAQIGIGVGCGIAGLVFLLFLGSLFLRRSRRNRRPEISLPRPSVQIPRDIKHKSSTSPPTSGMTEIGDKALPPTPRRLSFLQSGRLPMKKDPDCSNVVEMAGADTPDPTQSWRSPRLPIEVEGTPPVEIDGREAERYSRL